MDLWDETFNEFDRVVKSSNIKVVRYVLVIGSLTVSERYRHSLVSHMGLQNIIPIFIEDSMKHVRSYGVSVMKTITSRCNEEKYSDILILYLNHLSMGTECAGGVMSIIVNKNQTIPLKKTRVFTTYCDNSPSMCISIFEGERSMCKDNKRLGTFELRGVPPAPRGVPQIEVVFDIDRMNILTVSSIDTVMNVIIEVVSRFEGVLSKDMVSSLCGKYRLEKKGYDVVGRSKQGCEMMEEEGRREKDE